MNSKRKPDNLGGYKEIDEYVRAKSEKLRQSGKNYAELFELMFSEEENVLFEEKSGIKIIKTTYKEAKKLVQGLAPALEKKFADFPKGSYIGLDMPNSVEWIVALWAILAAGCNVVLINQRLGGRVLENCLAETQVRAVVTDTATGVKYGLPAVCPAELQLIDSSFEKKEFGTEILVMSSGTSSHVKCCAYTAREIADQILDSSKIIRECKTLKRHYNGELKQLALLPFCHVFGLTAVYFWFAFFSRTFVKIDSLSSANVRDTVIRHRVTHVFAVPLFFETVFSQVMLAIEARGDGSDRKLEKGFEISRKLDFCPPLRNLFDRIAFKEVRKRLFGDSISYFICGGSSVRPEVLEFFNRIGYPISNGYGMSEIGITSVELREKIRFAEPLSVGLPFSSIQYRVSGGKLEVSGSSRAKYIISDGKRTVPDEYFETNDLVSFDTEKKIYKILGRSDELVIGLSGENLNPQLIEANFDKLAAKTCLCAVKNGGKTVPTLVVGLNSNLSGKTKSALRDAVREIIRTNGLERQIENVIFTDSPLMDPDDIKLNRRRIASRVADGLILPVDFTAVAQNNGTSPVLSAVRAAFSKVLGRPEDELDAAADFFSELGGSSFQWFSLCADLSEELKIAIPESPEGISSIRSLASYAEDRIERISR